MVCDDVGALVDSRTKTAPAAVSNFLSSRNCDSEYGALVQDLYMAKRGRLDAWKSSMLYRVMYLGGHEKAFRQRGVSIFLTRETRKGALSRFKTSVIQVCFAEGSDATPPPQVYSDAAKVITLERDGAAPVKRSIPEGVFAQAYSESEPLQADMATMQVDFLKTLASKGALLDYMNMAALINTYRWSTDMAKQVALSSVAQFREKGLGLFFCVRTGFDRKLHEVDVPWFEFADLAVAGENYYPPLGDDLLKCFPDRSGSKP